MFLINQLEHSHAGYKVLTPDTKSPRGRSQGILREARTFDVQAEEEFGQQTVVEKLVQRPERRAELYLSISGRGSTIPVDELARLLYRHPLGRNTNSDRNRLPIEPMRWLAKSFAPIAKTTKRVWRRVGLGSCARTRLGERATRKQLTTGHRSATKKYWPPTIPIADGL